jgi:hypothetical protein
MDKDELRPLAERLLGEAQQMLDGFPRAVEMNAIEVSEVPTASFGHNDSTGPELWNALHGLHSAIVALRADRMHPYELQGVMDVIRGLLDE